MFKINKTMLLRKITISNFKNFDFAEIDLGKINVIVGANASGKSNLIQAIKFIKDIEEMGIDNAISLQGGIDFLTNIQLKEKRNCTISIELVPQEGSIIDVVKPHSLIALSYRKIKYLIEIKKKNGKKFEIVREELTYDIKIEELVGSNDDNEVTNPFSLLDFTYNLKIDKGKLSKSTTLEKKKLTVQLSNDQEYKIKEARLSPIIIDFDLIKRNVNKSESLLRQFNLLTPKSLDFLVYDFDVKNSKKPANITGKSSLEENGENLARVIKRILEDKNDKRKFSNLIREVLPFINEISIEKLYDNSLLFKVKENYNNSAIIPSSLLSDGTIAVTSIIAASFFEDKKLVIFEEPEKGIHPAIISKIMNLFYDASKNKQILITTHNPEIVKHTKLEDLLLMQRSANGFSTVIKPNEMESVHIFLKSDLGVDQLFIQNLLDI